MATTVEVQLLSDDPRLVEVVAALPDDEVVKWQLALFVCQQQLEHAIARRAIRDHYDAIHIRARATRESKKQK